MRKQKGGWRGGDKASSNVILMGGNNDIVISLTGGRITDEAEVLHVMQCWLAMN